MFKLFKYLSIYIIGILSLFLFPIFSQQSYAAGNGSLGASSSASSTITVYVPKRVDVTAINDIEFFGELSTNSNLTHNENICVYSNISDYQVIAHNTNSKNEVGYSIDWENDFVANNSNCKGYNNSNIKLGVNISYKGKYRSSLTDTLTLVIVPS